MSNTSSIPRPAFREARALPAAEAILFLAVVGVRVLFLAQTSVTYEDSLISLRYAENLAQGRGLVYNPGERVFGASTPFYVLLLALLAALRLPDPLLLAKLLCAAADGATAVLWFRLLRREFGSAWPGTFFAVAFGASPLLIQNSVSGMETSLALLCLTAAFAAERADRLTLLGVSLGLLMLVRPDGAVGALVILGARAGRERRLPWKPALLAAAIVLPWVLFAAWYYGTPVPNSIFAKAAAYNAHRHGLGPNLRRTLTHIAPYRTSLFQGLFNSVVVALLAAGVVEIVRRRRRLLALPLFWLAWWAYLVLPKTLLFRWYYPPLTMSAYALAAVGFGWMMAALARTKRGSHAPVAGAAVLAALLGCAVPWYTQARAEAALQQQAEEQVRKPLGRWLAEHTPPPARVAMEPIGYIGYYSGRRILDEVGLVSPEMIPLNRAGAGWFGRALRRFEPDLVVERPFYLESNFTLNSGVPMFAGDEDLAWFSANYEPVREFTTTLALPGQLNRDYHFVVFRRVDQGRTTKDERPTTGG